MTLSCVAWSWIAVTSAKDDLSSTAAKVQPGTPNGCSSSCAPERVSNWQPVHSVAIL